MNPLTPTTGTTPGGPVIELAAVPDRVQPIYRIVGREQVFATHATVDDAAAAWTPPT
ncbi:hypothetical protein [Streptomyces sp. NPDC047028]|uniref:hypothetical protein n=1 Tax=Streptomyces sp. NPDC047028 TaxID=3155793 RepID=UPI0034050F69